MNAMIALLSDNWSSTGSSMVQRAHCKIGSKFKHCRQLSLNHHTDVKVLSYSQVLLTAFETHLLGPPPQLHLLRIFRLAPCLLNTCFWPYLLAVEVDSIMMINDVAFDWM